MLGELLAGGQDIARQAGFVIAGGHTIDDPELGQITFEKGPDELESPFEALCFVCGEEGPGEPTTKPKTLESIESDLFKCESMEFEIGDSAGEGFRALPEQVGRGTPQHEEAARSPRPIGQLLRLRN